MPSFENYLGDCRQRGCIWGRMALGAGCERAARAPERALGRQHGALQQALDSRQESVNTHSWLVTARTRLPATSLQVNAEESTTFGCDNPLVHFPAVALSLRPRWCFFVVTSRMLTEESDM